MLFREVLTFKSVDDVTFSKKATKHYLHLVLFVMLCKMVLNETLHVECDHPNVSY